MPFGKILHRVAFLGFVAFALLLGGLYYYSRDLPSIATLETLQRPAQITIVDMNGELLTRYGQMHGKPVEVAELPDHVIQAFLATEDRNFYHHWGINPVAILRALIINIRSDEVVQGGSTITQQFAKNVFLTPDRTIKRKVQEMLLALQLEMTYSKDEILAYYLNNVYFGAGTHGLRSASERYFEKDPADLSVGEAAMLAGLLKAPSRYSPAAHPDAARQRARVVLQAMADAGYLTRGDAETIKASRIARVADRRNFAPYATDFVMAELGEVLPTRREDIIIHTTIDLAATDAADVALESIPARDTRVADDVQAAMIALERDGAIRVLIGGKSYAESEYNRATQAKRQPGSAFKPFVYLAALEDGRQPDDIVLDTPVELGNWSPSNYKDKYYGAVRMSEALARSLNAAAIRLQEETGRQNVIAVARRLGFEDKLDPGPALALGVNEITPLGLAAAYLPFANNGFAIEPYAITSIYTEEGKVLYARKRDPGYRVIGEENLIALNHMLRQTVDMGSGQAARLPGYVAMGKTGTTQESRDAWFAGHAGGMTGVIWLGKDDYAPMRDGWSPVSGSGAPAVLWKDMMQAALNGRPDVPYTPWEPEPFYSPFFDPFRNLFRRETQGQDDLAGRYSVTYDPADQAVSGMPVQAPPMARNQDNMDALMEDVMAEEEARTQLPEGDDLGRLLREQTSSADEADGPSG